MFLVVTFVLPILFCLANADAPIQSLFLNSVASNNVLIAFGSTQCQFTKHFLSIWKDFEHLKLPTVGTELKKMLVHCDKEVDFCVAERVKYYPSIRFYAAGSADWPLVFKGKRSLQRLVSFVAKAQLTASREPEADDRRPSDGVEALDDGSFDRATSGSPVLVKFFTDWCPHCRELRPLFAQLPAAAKAASISVAVASVNCEQQQDTCSRQQVQHYPLLALYAAGRRLAVYEEAHSIEGWLGFLRSQLAEFRSQRRQPAPDGAVPDLFLTRSSEPVALTEEDFEATVKAAPLAFVKFFAPWCVHCKRLAPVWAQLAQQAGSEFGESALIGSVDCTQQAPLCSRHRISGYPTLLLFRAGAVVDTFRGVRDLSALITFLRQWAARPAASDEL